tara:strand:+ start:1441 stop:1752 length:312 start_codon:yes stop_codon:yes gene_type:complete
MDIENLNSIKSTILNTDIDIRSERRCGNTTRQADYALQALLKDNVVQVVDHSLINKATRMLVDIILKRFRYEHNKEEAYNITVQQHSSRVANKHYYLLLLTKR